MQHLCYHPCGFLSISGKMYGSMSNPGEVLRFVSNWTTRSTGCAGPRQFLWVLALRPYSPGGSLNALAYTPSCLRASEHRLRLGLHRYLICFATLAFVPQRQEKPRRLPSLLVFQVISTHFTATLPVLSPRSILNFVSISTKPKGKPWSLNGNFTKRLRTLYAQWIRIMLAPYVLPRLLARS